jgi:glutamate--cysteine ligase catalytic subunit
VSLYLEHIRKRALGEIDTPATWIRKFVTSHPLYKHDSVVSDEICYDLVVACKEIGEGFRHEPSLLGDIKIEEVTAEGAFDVKLDSRRLTNLETMKLISRYSQRKHFQGRPPPAAKDAEKSSSDV